MTISDLLDETSGARGIESGAAEHPGSIRQRVQRFDRALLRR